MVRSGRDVGIHRDALGFCLEALQNTCAQYGCATPAASPGSLLLSLGVELKMIDYFVEVNVPMSDSMSSRM